MDRSPRDDQLLHEYDEIPSRDPMTDLNPNNNPQTIREFQTKLEDLNRENFDLKLRIFFLEQNDSNGRNPSSTPTHRPRHPSKYESYDHQDSYLLQQTDYENDQPRSSLSPIRRQSNIANNTEYDELRSLRNRNGRDREENDNIRRPFRQSGEFGDYAQTLNIDPTTQTFVTTPVDSNSVSTMPISTYNLQFQERERKFQEENNLLKKEILTLKSRLNELSNECKHTNEQYEASLRTNKDQEAKAERVIKRMKADYDARITNLEDEQRQKLAEYESYRHEQEQTNSNVNIEEYLRRIEQQERLIKQLNDRLSETNEYEQKPYTVHLPSSINPQAIDENTRRLNEYADTIDQLRAECDELRRSEKYLRKQIDDLNRLFESSNARLPPLLRSSIVDEIQQVADPKSAIIQTSLQLRNDAENVSGLTNRIAQMIRECEDNQNKLKEKDAQIRQYEIREKEFENRTLQKFDLQIEQLEHENEHLKKQIENRERRLEELTAENTQLRLQPQRDDEELESHYSREKQNYEERIQIADEHINDLQQQLDREHHNYDTLSRDYEKVKTSLDSSNIESLEETIQQQEKQIENSQAQLQELENNLQRQRIYLERERDFEKGKAEQNHNELDIYKKRYHDLHSQYEKLRPILDDQQTKYEKQIRDYKNELAQIEQERDDLNDKLQLLEYEKEELAARQTLENDPKFLELVEANKELNEQISRYEIRFHDCEDENKRYKTELNTIQENYEIIIQQYDELKLNHTKIQNQLTSLSIENDQINEENTKLKNELNELEANIRLQVNQEYENQYRDRFNDLNERKNGEIENVLRDKEAVEFELERMTNEKNRFENQLNKLQNELEQAHEIIENYDKDLDRLRQDLNKSKENNEQIERQLAQTYAEKLKDQNDRIQELEEQLQSNRKRLPLSNNQSSNYYEEPIFEDNDPYVKHSNAPNNQELIYQLENKLREQDDIIQNLRNSRAINENEPTDIRLDVKIRIQNLEQDLETKKRFIDEYKETVQAQEQQIEKLLENIQQSDSPQFDTIETLKEELDNRNRRIDEILNEKNSTIDQRERQISELQLTIKDREHTLAEINERLGEAEQKIDEQQLEIENLIREKNRLIVVPEDRQAYLKQIQDLEKQLEMEKKTNGTTPSDHRDQYQNVIKDLKDRIRQREDTIQKLEHSLTDSNQQLKDTRQAQHKMATDLNRTNLHTDQLTSDVENRDQTITSLRQKLSEKDQEINALHENNLAKEQKLNELYSKMIQDEPGLKRTQSTSNERIPNDVPWKTQLQKKDQEINDLKQKLNEAQQERPDQLVNTRKEPKLRSRSHYDDLNREELLFELEKASKLNEDLNKQLQNPKEKLPNITELYNQSNEVRNELARQKYVNQVLWRKINALVDIQGSTTRHELSIELANYQDELAKLKSQQPRMNDARSTIVNANSRSSSEQNLNTLYNGLSSMGQEFPSKNIKSTIALLERSNIEWQTKLARLTEQLGRSESQSRNYHRELIKYQKLLCDAGLTESSVRQRRRSADDSVIIGLNDSNIIQDDLTKIDNLDELKEIIRNQRKYNQQLQMRIRLNTSDTIESPMIEKLHNLNLVIETYKNESNLLKNELKKLYKTIEYNRRTSQQYEQLIKDQQLTIEHSTKSLTKYDQLLKKYDIHLPIFDDNKEHFMDSIDEFIIDLDIDIISNNDNKKKKISFGKKDSAYSSATDTIEQQRQIQDKDEQINNLNNQLKERDEQIQQLINELNNSKKIYEDNQYKNRNDYDRIHRDLTDELRTTQNELEQVRLEFNTLKTSRPKYEQIEEQNQRLRVEIKHLQNEIESNKPLLEHYKNQIDILEKRTPIIHDNDTSEMTIRSSELSQLLEEMRLLRRDLERSIQKQNELRNKLDENLRQSQSPREFTFTGRGVSYPDLRLIDTSGLIGSDNLSLSNPINGKRLKPTGSSSTEFDHIDYPQLSNREFEQIISIKSYIIGEIKIHNDLQLLIENIKFDLKAIGQELKDKLRSKTNSSITDAFIRSFEERLINLDERLTHALDLFETYWRADLPEKNRDNEHIFIDQRLLEENKHLLSIQRKYIRDTQILREKYKQQSNHVDQLLAQLTKVNRKKADTGEYLALLLRPTLDVLQKARSNIENHLIETNTNNTPPGSAQSHRRHRSNRQE